MQVIPAIDVLNGKVVRLQEGDYDKATIYDVTLEEMIEQFDSQGTDFVHIIDLNGAKGDFSNQAALVKILKKSNLKIQYGGGIRSLEKIKEMIDLGFHRLIIGTQAIKDPDFLGKLSREFCMKDSCSDKLIVAIDVLDEVIKYSGWMESSPIKLVDYVDKCASLGFFRFLCTDIKKDGKMEGSGIPLYKKLLSNYPFIKLIASGGISTLDDLRQLADIKVEAAVVGKAIYEKKLSIEEVKDWNLQAMVSF
jgi:phosphoribosylformimino-5-aminoimidazole carboxamide ribotide isomerase